MSFNSILGNGRAKSILAKSLRRQRLPNSLLFIGPEGVGKEDAALVVAKALNCQNKKDDSCEECPSCLAINRGNFPDVMVLRPETDMYRIEQLKILKATAYLKPMVGKKRIFIIAESEKMREDAANSLLKILEEPPPSTSLILLSSNPYLILATIQSRCQVLSFSPVFKEDIEKMLVEKGYEPDQARIISHLVEGSMKQADSLDWRELQEKRRKDWMVFLSLLRKEKISLSLREYIASRYPDKRELVEMFEIFSSFCRDVLLIKAEGDRHHLLNLDYRTEIEAAADCIGFQQSLDLMGKIDYSLYALKKNCNVRLLMSYFFSAFLVSNHV